MNPNRRPRPGISPVELMESWLPAELRRLGGHGLPPATVRITLADDSGARQGCWDLLSGPDPRVVPCSDAARPRVTLRLSTTDWMAITVGEPGPVDLCPPGASPTDLLFLDSPSQQMLDALSGMFLFEVRGYNGRTWRLWATFGDQQPGQEPDAVIATDAETYGAILSGALSGPEAYFTGKITIEGDAGLGMQVGMGLMPKF